MFTFWVVFFFTLISVASLMQHNWQWNDMNVIWSAETKLIINSVFNGWLSLWSEGALISYVPYFDTTSDATTVAPICDLFYYVLLVALETICEHWCFPSNNSRQKLSCCRFLCTVHYSVLFEVATIRHNTSVECDNAFYFLHELLWCCSSDWKKN